MELVAQGFEDVEVVTDGVVGVLRTGVQTASGQGGVVLWGGGFCHQGVVWMHQPVLAEVLFGQGGLSAGLVVCAWFQVAAEEAVGAVEFIPGIVLVFYELVDFFCGGWGGESSGPGAVQLLDRGADCGPDGAKILFNFVLIELLPPLTVVFFAVAFVQGGLFIGVFWLSPANTLPEGDVRAACPI